jgi:predicted 3-demethylubiquinone-9 3-methyltransferase (glyoxalase superfamily)
LQKISPCLWFDDQAEEAARFYVSVFPNSRMVAVTRYGAEGAKVSGRPAGSVMTVKFEIAGQSFVALNGGPVFKISPAISFIVNCQNQSEIDLLWTKLSDGGIPQRCGWLQDRFGVSWQIVPAALEAWLQSENAAGAERVMKTLLPMTKLEIEPLRRAFESSV